LIKEFYAAFKRQHQQIVEAIAGIDGQREHRRYASVLLNRLMFVYFLQRKGLLGRGDTRYLQNSLAQSRARGPDRFYGEFLATLCFEGFAKHEHRRGELAQTLLGSGTVPYLNRGLFLPHQIEQKHRAAIPDRVFEELFDLFERYAWSLDEAPRGDEINPAALGYIFEKHIDQKVFGAYYTRAEIAGYLCAQTIHRLVLDKINLPAEAASAPPRRFESIDELMAGLDARLCHRLLFEVLPNLSLLDPACGSGAFLLAALRALIEIYSAAIGRIESLNDPRLGAWLRETRAAHPGLDYAIKKRVIADNLFGVDIMEEAAEIARLRLFLALLASVETAAQIEPLPSLDRNILAGNSLVGLLCVDATCHERLMRQCTPRQSLDALLLDQFRDLKIAYAQAAWDAANHREARPARRPLTLDDIAALRPFHWGYEFDQIMNERGGFDIIITNPPWEVFKPQAKEFFDDYSPIVSKNKMRIKQFEQEQMRLLQNAAVRTAWLEYLSRFPHQCQYFRSAPQYPNQTSVVDGKRAGTDTNLYKLFVEQCYNLLRAGGQCGIVLPSGICTDLGAKQLRELLFDRTTISGLFCFENRKAIFEAVDSRFKFVMLTFEKGGRTDAFPAAFMRHDLADLAEFPRRGALPLSVELIRRLAPDSLSIMEFRNEIDIAIAEKMIAFPLLGRKVPGTWNLTLGSEFHMTNDSDLFKTAPEPRRLPLYEGRLIHQFTHRWATTQHYWVDEREGRAALLGRGTLDTGQRLDYQGYRFGCRSIGRNTDIRTLIVGPLPRNVFCGNSILVLRGAADSPRPISGAEMLATQSLLNSFVVDFYLRRMVSANINKFFISQLPIPRLTERDPAFAPIVERAARLVCTTPDFDGLAREVGLGSHASGARDAAERAKLRADIDGLIARLYGLTEAEFVHILDSFPLVAPAVKVAALLAYRAFVCPERGA
jgi:hypothetical protein